MADYSREYRRSTSSHKEDPRLRREHTSSPKHTSSNDAGLNENNWQNHPGSQYSQPLQTSYQHLQTAMYGDQTQYTAQGYQNAYAGYQAYPNSAYGTYDGYGQAQGAYVGIASGSLQPGPPGEEYPQGGWAPVGAGGYVNSQQSTATAEVKASVTNPAVAQEMKHQKAELAKQREEYERRISVLRRELDLLRRQKQDLMQDSSDRDTELILRENSKLQVEIQNKLKDAYNVIEILTGIIGDSGDVSKDEDASHKDRTNSAHRSLSSDVNADTKYNYVHYDPELHWCRMCDVFPKTAKDLLMHLHSKEHRDMMQAENIEIPWHKLPPEPEFPYIEGASKKRLPIKGLQFFVSATAWYCRLCDSWIGDLHCASQHLKSLNHSHNYSNFVEQNPHWEIEWLKDRERALERINRGNKSSDSEENHEKKKKKHKSKYSPSSSSGKDKRKKKRSKKRKKDSSDSSSSSSSSGSSSDDEKNDTSKSIHVAMRNKMKLQAQMIMSEELISGKWEALGRFVEEQKRKESGLLNEMVGKENEVEDNLINQWMTVKQPQDKDKALLDNLKDRLKQKQEAEKVKLAELERKRREKEREEQEKKEKEEREAKEREEQKRKEREEFERLKEDREQVKFRTKEKQQYRKKKSASRSPEHKRPKSRSPSSEYKRRSSEQYRRYEEEQSSRGYNNSPGGRHKRKHDDRDESSSRKDKKPPPPPPYKKLPFIGRMPLFKNKKNEDKVEKEIKKEDYDIPRQTRFQPGNLARAFIPEPEVVCFPKLSSYPPITMPPPPAPVIHKEPPAPPKISESPVPKAPPPPKINEDAKLKKEKQLEKEEEATVEEDSKDVGNFEVPMMDDDDPLTNYHEPFGLMMGSYSYDYMYPPNPPMFTHDYTQDITIENGGKPPDSVPLSHTMPLQPPPLPPDDPNEDLVLLGISSDDLAAQMFKK